MTAKELYIISYLIGTNDSKCRYVAKWLTLAAPYKLGIAEEKNYDKDKHRIRRTLNLCMSLTRTRRLE